MSAAPRGGLIPIPVPDEERETLFREIERSASVGGYVWEPGRRLIWSDGFFRLLEIDPGPGSGAGMFFDKVHPDDRARVERDWRNALAGEMYPTQYRLLRRDGSVRHIRGQGTVTRAADGSV